ncbi:MAG: TIGR00341 family protein [Snowella sp.]|nr:MAG: TIGR00341 family protein [Snowella sp.]
MSTPKIILKYLRWLKWKQMDAPHLNQVRSQLLDESKLDMPYLILIISSCMIATFGLLSNSTAVIIGAMLVAPLMLPIRGLAFGALVGDSFLFRTGSVSVVVGTILAVILSCLMGWLTGITNYGSEILARTQPDLLDLGIAVAAGAIGGYSKIQSKVSDTFAGTAIAVALMPPVCVVGLGLSQGNWILSRGATLLYLTNLLGIALACMMVFLSAGYAPLRQAGKPLLAAIILTSLLLIPLGLSFSRLVQNARIQRSIRDALTNGTVTFQRLELTDLRVNWLEKTPQVLLSVNAHEPVTEKQVKLLESFLEREIGQQFTLIFTINRVEEVRAKEIIEPLP